MTMARSLPPADAGITRLFFLFFSFFLSSTTALFIADRSALKLELASSSSSSIPDRLSDRQPPELRARRDSCPSGQFSCGSAVPSDFCCAGSKSETTCMVLASNTTALCCPAESDCDIIQPITCNITNQDHSLFPDSPIMTSALGHYLPRCGDACCPFGYTCNDSKECVLSSNQSDYGYLLDDSTEPVTTSASSATAASATATASGTTVLQGTSPPSIIPASASATSTATPKNKSGSTSGLVAVCTIVSICCAVGLGTFIWVTRVRKRAKQEKQARKDFLLREAKENKAPSPGSSFVTEDDDSTWEALKMTPSPGKPSPGPRRFNVRRGANDRLAAIPESQYYSPGSFAVHNPVMSPVELPASPVSFCMWQNLELAEVQEPKLAYIVPAKQ